MARYLRWPRAAECSETRASFASIPPLATRPWCVVDEQVSSPAVSFVRRRTARGDLRRRFFRPRRRRSADARSKLRRSKPATHRSFDTATAGSHQPSDLRRWTLAESAAAALDFPRRSLLCDCSPDHRLEFVDSRAAALPVAAL